MYGHGPIQVDRPQGGARSNAEAATCARQWVDYALNDGGAA